jgi:hypothetical protein
MKSIKLFGQEYQLDASFFEMVVTLLFMSASAVLAVFNFPNNVPISVIQFTIIVALLGFAIGFGVSNFFLWAYKGIKKTMGR